MFPLFRPLIVFVALAISVPCAAQGQRGGLIGRSALPTPLSPALRSVASPALDARDAGLRRAESTLARVRQLETNRLLRLHRQVLDVDPRGALILRGEVVAIDPSPLSLDRIENAGFRVIDDSTLHELGLRVVLLRSPEGTGSGAALRVLRRLDPAGTYDFNHVYLGSASARPGTSATASRTFPDAGAGSSAVRVGLIDSGITPGHPSLAGVQVSLWGCGGKSHPDAHGTAVASLLVGPDEARRQKSTSLFAADIYCGAPGGGAATGFAQAMAWMARERVDVVNLSLVGAHNKLLQRAVQAMAERGHVMVAAVGNDGPASPPLYPAAYPEVIGVTAVDRRQRVLPEAGRGTHVDFAAPGSDLRVALTDGQWGSVRGTSFAAPLVAYRAAVLRGRLDGSDAARVRSQLLDEALDLGPRGPDQIYGNGLLHESKGARAQAK